MSLKSELNQFVSGVADKIGDGYDNLKQKFTSWKNEAGAYFSGLYAGDVTGIDVNKIPMMQEAIQTYVTSIQTTLDRIIEDNKPDQAFADSGMKEAITDFNQAVVDVCKNYTSQLLKLYDLLSDIQKYYQENQEKMSANLRSEASNTRSTVEEYTVGSGSTR